MPDIPILIKPLMKMDWEITKGFDYTLSTDSVKTESVNSCACMTKQKTVQYTMTCKQESISMAADSIEECKRLADKIMISRIKYGLDPQLN